MIVSCPACSTRYLVEPMSLGPKGRQVRCAKCGHRWQQRPPADMPLQVDLPPPDNFPVPQRLHPASRGGWGLGLPMLILVLLLLGLGAGYFFRDRVIQHWPQTAHIYELIGLPGRTAGAGLEVSNVNFHRRDAKGQTVLEVQGRISNKTEQEMMVPSLNVTLRDGSDRPLYSWTFNMDQASIRAGETIEFMTRTQNPPAEASRISVTFAGASD
jgi:predicted Zn finger-like uncharacterized protein